MHDRSPKRRVTDKRPATEPGHGRPAPRARSSAVDDVASASRDRADGRFAKPTSGAPRAGVALPATLRSTMEARFGHPFADVRVHDDALAHRTAQSAGALALTQGRDIRFASGAYQPRTWTGLELLAHELAHVVQQSGGNAAARRTVGTASASHEREADVAAHRVSRGLRAGRLSPARPGARQRKPGDPFRLNVGEGVTLEGVEGKLGTVIKYKARSWITLDVKRGNLNVSVNRKKGIGTALRITVESHSWVEAQLDIATENRILADNRNKAGFLVHYEFKIHGTVTRGVNGVPGPDVRRGPSQRMVGQYHTPGKYDVERHVRGAPGFVQFEKWGPLDVPDSVKTFKSKSKLNRYLKKHPDQNFAIVKMPDGRWGVRPLSEKGLAKIADIARSGKYGESDWLSRFDWYKNDWAKGELRGFSLGGQRIKALAGLENLYFSDDLFASIGGEGSVREAEVFKMGPNDSTFGRKPLSHEQALARWAEIDAMSVDKFDKTETAPGRPLHQLVVRGASGAHHKVGRDYLLGKVAFHTKVKSIDAQPDDDAKRKASDSLAFPMVRDYVTVIADRPKDDPAFVKALQTHRPLAQHLATYFYTKAENEGQQWVASTFTREAAAVRDQLADQENLPRLIFSFPQLSASKKQHVLELAGFEKDVLETWKKTLSDPAKASSISVGNTVDGLDIGQFRNQAEKTAKGMDDLVDQVMNDKIIAIRDKSPFGDMVRQVVYRKLGYSLDAKKFPHSNKVPSLGILGFDPLSGSRSSFTSIREQMFASKMRSLASVDEFEKWATRATIALASLLIVVTLNAAGLGIAAAFATEGTLKFFVIQSIVVGAGMTGVEFVQHKMAGTDMSPGQVLEAGAWNIATAGLLGRLGWGLRNASTARRTFWMASAFMGAGTARFMADRRGKFTRAELTSFLIENGVMFLVMEGVGVMTRSLNESALAIGRAKRLGVHADEIAALRGKVDAFKSELAAYASKPGEISRQAKALQAKEKALLQENQALLEKLRAKAKTKGDAAALEKDLSAQLKGIREHLDAMKKAEYLAELRIKPVGTSQTEYSYEGAAADASSRLEKLYAGSKATVDPDGTIRLKTPDAPDPLLFVPASSVKAASPRALPKAGTQKVDINAAEPSELTQLNGVGKELAKAIKEHRDANGKFESVGDLAKVPGIGKGTLAKIRAQNMATVKPQKPGKPVAEWRGEPDEATRRGRRARARARPRKRSDARAAALPPEPRRPNTRVLPEGRREEHRRRRDQDREAGRLARKEGAGEDHQEALQGGAGAGARRSARRRPGLRPRGGARACTQPHSRPPRRRRAPRRPARPPKRCRHRWLLRGGARAQSVGPQRRAPHVRVTRGRQRPRRGRPDRHGGAAVQVARRLLGAGVRDAAPQTLRHPHVRAARGRRRAPLRHRAEERRQIRAQVLGRVARRRRRQVHQAAVPLRLRLRRADGQRVQVAPLRLPRAGPRERQQHPRSHASGLEEGDGQQVAQRRAPKACAR